MTLIKLDDAAEMLREKFSIGVRGTIIAALRALPTVSVSEEMVERVAKAMAADRGFDWDGKYKNTEYANHGYWLPCARAALEATLGATVSDGWEDIATHDGTENENVLISGTTESGRKWVSMARFYEGQWWELNNDPTDAWGGPEYPTKWRPLPAPPSE